MKSYSQQSQYGFAIADELEADCFFHRLDLVDGRPVQTGDEVEFEVVVCDRGLRASGVRVVQRGVGR